MTWSFAAAALAGAVVVAGFSGPVSAQAITEACYAKKYVAPQYQTGMRKVRDKSNAWVNLDGAGIVRYVRNPAVYVQTRKKVADDYYLLVPTACK